MVNSIGFNKLKTAVFISGTGSNLKKLIEFSLTKKSPIEIVLVISNNNKANGLNYAKKFKIKKKIFKLNDINLDENKILRYLKKNKIKLICLAGFMKILSRTFIKRFRGKILNIHPSLLPKYKGLNTHERALKNKEKFSGCTVHFVTPKLDSGKIIMQKKVNIKKNDTPKKLGKRILKQEHILYAKAIMKLFSSP
tara:strand:+ start:537 stop:1121 length:585 start_codon:yes stop_codon:yes gene_type:complete